MKRLTVLASVLVSAAVALAADPGYTCSMKVGNPKNDSKVEKPKDKGGSRGRSSTQTKTMKQKLTWAVKVSFRGKSIPNEGLKLKCFAIGTTNDEPAILNSQEIEIKLDEKGDFSYEYAPPEMTQTKTKKQSGKGSTTTVKGDRISGCVIQLLVGNEVKRSFATKSTWAKLAAKDPLPEEEILKFR